MKEQLANMTIIELVRTAHSYATSIQQIDTYSAIVTELAARLEALNLAHIGGMNSLRSAISDRDQLAAENAALKDAVQTHSESVHFCEVCGKDDPCSTDDVCYVLKEIPATDAWQREQMAKGVDAFAAHKRERQQALRSRSMRMSEEAAGMAADAENFAAQLRNGEAV